jgi:Tfp pilus assembly protein FimV
VINPNGRSVLRVTSSKPLPEPVVKFLVQVMWPQGRLLRDYSVLLDQAKAQGSQPSQANINPAQKPAATPPSAVTRCGRLPRAIPRAARSSRPCWRSRR